MWKLRAVSCVCLLSALSAQGLEVKGLEIKTAKMATADTAVTVEAGADAPRLLQLSGPDGFVWAGQKPDELIGFVEAGGQRQTIHWSLNLAACQIEPSRVEFVYDSKSPRLRLFWDWRVRASQGPVEHSVRIENLSGHEMWLPLQDSLQVDWRIPAGTALEDLWVEKGAGGPSAEGTHRNAMTAGYEWTGTSSTYAHPPPGKQREMIPFALIHRGGANGDGWYMGIEFSGRTRIMLRRSGDSLEGTAGLNPEPGPFRTLLKAGESFETPTVFIGAYRGDADDAGNTLRRWVRQVLNNPAAVADPHYPLLVNNSWGSGMAINEKQARQHDPGLGGAGI